MISKNCAKYSLVLMLCFSTVFCWQSKGQDLPATIPVIFGMQSVDPVQFDEATGLPMAFTENDPVSYSFQVTLPDTTNIASIKIHLGTSVGANDVYVSDEAYVNYIEASTNLFRNGSLMKNCSGSVDYESTLYYEFSIYDLSGNCSHKAIGTFND